MILPGQADTNVSFVSGVQCVGFQAMNQPRQGSLNVKLV